MAQLCGTVKGSLLLLLLLFVVVVVFVSGLDLCLWTSGSRDKKFWIWYASCCKRSAAEHCERDIDKCIPLGERIACVTGYFSRSSSSLFLLPPNGQPHTVFEGFISLSGEWMLLWKELIIAEYSPHITICNT